MPGTDGSAASSLLDKLAITEALLRYARGVDSGDELLLRSAYHEDSVDERGWGTNGGWELAAKLSEDMRSSGRRSTHVVANVLVELAGATAVVESYGLATLVEASPDGDVHHRVGVRYLDRFEKRDGAWAIRHRRVMRDWTRVETAASDADRNP